MVAMVDMLSCQQGVCDHEGFRRLTSGKLPTTQLARLPKARVPDIERPEGGRTPQRPPAPGAQAPGGRQERPVWHQGGSGLVELLTEGGDLSETREACPRYHLIQVCSDHIANPLALKGNFRVGSSNDLERRDISARARKIVASTPTPG